LWKLNQMMSRSVPSLPSLTVHGAGTVRLTSARTWGLHAVADAATGQWGIFIAGMGTERVGPEYMWVGEAGAKCGADVT
jgi:hypothetical protein